LRSSTVSTKSVESVNNSLCFGVETRAGDEWLLKLNETTLSVLELDRILES
jgi:hypothetical protein